MKLRQAIILAAGEGQRLRPLTVYKPKVMIPIGNKPILQYIVEALVKEGIREIVLVVGYRKEVVMSHFGDGRAFGANIKYVFQDVQLGTGHALKLAEEKAEDLFLVLPGDNIVESRTISPLIELDFPAILVKEGEESSKYGVVIEEGGTLREIVERPKMGSSNLINTGVYLLSRNIFSFLEEEINLPSAVSEMAKEKEIRVIRAEGEWLDAVYPWDILRINHFVLKGISSSTAGRIEGHALIKGKVRIGKGTRIRSYTYVLGPAVIGENCEIGPNVCIFPSTSIGDGSRISPFTEIRNSIIGEGVRIGTGSLVEASIIGKGTYIGAKFTSCEDEVEVRINDERLKARMGTVAGEGCEIGDNVGIKAGVRMGNRAKIRGLKIVGEDVPDNALLI